MIEKRKKQIIIVSSIINPLFIVVNALERRKCKGLGGFRDSIYFAILTLSAFVPTHNILFPYSRLYYVIVGKGRRKEVALP